MRIAALMLAATIAGCDGKPDPNAPVAELVGRRLSPGDLAPELVVSRWLHGGPVALERGKVYVVDFWASWCGPCLRGMPHLDSLAREFPDATFIAVTTKDHQGNDLARVERYINSTGKNFKIHFAWCDTAVAYDAWMTAAGLSAIPCAFVIDREGKIVTIGQSIDEVLPRVIAGKWRGQADLDEIAATNLKLLQIIDRVQAAGGAARDKLPEGTDDAVRQTTFGKAAAAAAAIALDELEVFTKDYPRQAGTDDILTQKMVFFMRVGKLNDAQAIALPLLARSQAQLDPTTIDIVRRYWLGRALNPDRKHLDVATTAGDMILAMMTDEDVTAVLAAAEAHAAAGNQEKYEQLAQRARELTKADRERSRIVENNLKAFQK